MNFLTRAKIVRLGVATAAGTTEVTSAALDLAGFNTAVFLTNLSAPAANNTIKAQSSVDSDGSPDSWADLEGSLLSSGPSSIVALEIHRPKERYIRPVISRGTSSAIGEIWGILFNARDLPVDNNLSGTIASLIVNAPIEGAA